MITNFAIAFKDMGLGVTEISVIAVVSVIFPILFVIASRNLDAKGVF